MNFVALAQLQAAANRFGYGRLVAVGQCGFDLEAGGHVALQCSVILDVAAIAL